ncbi:hypothetical protein ACIQXA_32940 [Streptomyces massasporeus]|uniref:hypothetical protein n=1 Tax=Streptomyces massasporeus TaxID=67324 RepID=UPI0037F39657
MPSDSTLDSAPEDASQQPAAEPFEALLAPSLDAPQAGTLDQLGCSGLAAPEDHCQALTVAMFEGAWEHETDLADDRSVRSVLSQYARPGWDFERDHQLQGFSIGCIPGGWEQRDTVPGPEDLVIPRLVPRAQQLETESVQYVVGRFNEQEQAVLRAWAESHPMPWTKAPALVQQDEAQGEHNRHKLKRVAKEWRRHEINRRELA